MGNKTERVFDKIIKEIVEEENIEWISYSHDWIYRIKKGEKVRYIFGYNFDNNSANVYQIVNDKAGTWELLDSLNIPAVPHHLFRLPSGGEDESTFFNAMDKAKEYNYKVVCKKNNQGTGGADVYKATKKSEVEKTLVKLFSKTNSISLSPLLDITHEYRTIILDGDIKLVYSKNRQAVEGDGRSMLKDLICEKFGPEELKSIILGVNPDTAEMLNKVVECGEYFTLNWKHNLGLGAEPEILEDGEKRKELESIAKKAAKELNIGFASIDIVEADGKLYVLEINSGVMMERFAVTARNGYNIAKEIYRSAVNKMMETY